MYICKYIYGYIYACILPLAQGEPARVGLTHRKLNRDTRCT